MTWWAFMKEAFVRLGFADQTPGQVVEPRATNEPMPPGPRSVALGADPAVVIGASRVRPAECSGGLSAAIQAALGLR